MKQNLVFEIAAVLVVVALMTPAKGQNGTVDGCKENYIKHVEPLIQLCAKTRDAGDCSAAKHIVERWGSNREQALEAYTRECVSKPQIR